MRRALWTAVEPLQAKHDKHVTLTSWQRVQPHGKSYTCRESRLGLNQLILTIYFVMVLLSSDFSIIYQQSYCELSACWSPSFTWSLSDPIVPNFICSLCVIEWSEAMSFFIVRPIQRHSERIWARLNLLLLECPPHIILLYPPRWTCHSFYFVR
jgi:hypothetical protein